MAFEDLRKAVEALTGGKETVILDDYDLPSIMVIWEKCTCAELCPALSNAVHPAFISEDENSNQVEYERIYISKYPNIVKNSRAYSLPLEDAAVGADFEQALNYCQNKGFLWGLTPAAVWGLLALSCHTNGTPPHGNSNNGSDYNYPTENGLLVGSTGRTLTGSGALSWNHNRAADGGITDLVGIGSEWIGGLRVRYGELQFIPNANSLLPAIGQGLGSSYWRALNASNQFVEPGSADTLKLDYVDQAWQITTSVTSSNNSNRSGLFKVMTAASGLTVPEYLKALMLYPAHSSRDSYGNETITFNNHTNLASPDELMAIRGGSCQDGVAAGINFWNATPLRSLKSNLIKFRSVYYGEN